MKSPLSRALLFALALLMGTANSAPRTTPKPPTTAAALPELAPLPARPQVAPPLTPLAPLSAPATTAYQPRDPLFRGQWNLREIQLPGAWADRPGSERGAAVTVAVLDTGYVNSPELAGRVVNGYDFVSDPARSGDGDGRDRDASGRGQFAYHAEVIGNIIGAAHDGRGMVGINPQARVVQVRVGGTDGMIDPQDLADAMRWAVGLPAPGAPANPNPARVLNLSLYADFIPLTGCDARIQAAIDAVTARGALVVTGAANDGADAGGYTPAGCRNVLTVTSVDERGQRPGYANWGASVSLAAPGGEPSHGIPASSLSGPGGERSPNGTSFAAPHASGVASLLFGLKPTLTPAQVRDILIRTATPFPGGAVTPTPARPAGAAR